MGLVSQTLRWKPLFEAMICGAILSLATGFIENRPEASIIGFTHYGYPLVWRVTKTLQPSEVKFTSLAIDAAFWTTLSLLALILLKKIAPPKLRVSSNYRKLFLPLVLFIPLGLLMDFVHEFGHGLWGIAVGGRLAYMKIAYFEIYPQFALTAEFVLGYVRVEGLTTEFAGGLFLLGGSLTTNIVSWVLALILLKTKLGNRTQVALRILGLFGLLDLPFYVFLPQIGLRHWIFLGGDVPEPLLGARKMGIPEQGFYLTTILITLGLVFLHFRTLREKAWRRTKTFLRSVRSKH